jgi:hypothetical protein
LDKIIAENKNKNNQIKIYDPIYQNQDRKKLPTNTFYKLLTKKITRTPAQSEGLENYFCFIFSFSPDDAKRMI